MAAGKSDTKELFVLLDSTTSELLKLISSLSEKVVNTIPFEDSWTAAQLTSHVTKSNKAIAQALHMEGKTSERNPGKRVQELKATFLDFTAKFESPEFIFPKLDIYQKDTLITSFKNSVAHLNETGNKVNLYEIISVPVFGEITKFELLHFVLYHTQRHIHQLKNILKMIHTKNGFIEGRNSINN